MDSFALFILFAGVILFYVFGVLLRLAAFHPLETVDHFLGLPAPAAAIVVLGVSYITIPFIGILLVIALISILMIVPVKYMKPSMRLNVVTVILIVLVMIFDTMFSNLFIWLLIGLITVYILFGLLCVQNSLVKKNGE